MDPLERSKEALKVMELQKELNDGLKQTFQARAAFYGVRKFIPEFCKYVVQHERWEDFKDIRMEPLIAVWHDVVGMKQAQLEEAMALIRNQIEKMEASNSQSQ